MILVPRKAFVSLCLLFFSFSAFAQNENLLFQMSWLEGYWINPDSTVIEQWRPQGEFLIGVVNEVEDVDSYFKNWEKLVVLESLELEQRDGKWVYKALTREHDWQPVEFIQESSTKDEIVFYNAKNDFPKWIIYNQTKPGTLLIILKNETESKEFLFNKISP
mgnify:CR=1 FL=1